MLIKELVDPNIQANADEPTPKDVADIQALLGTIDPVNEQPQTLLNKLNSWIKEYPLLDKVTDIIPQTRLVKSIAQAIDALDAGDSKTALNALAGAVGGQLATVAKAVNVGSALAQGDVKQAALNVGGNIANVAKGASAVSNLARGNTVAAVGDVAGKGVQNALQYAQSTLAQKPATTAVAQAEPDELDRIKKLANIQPM